MADITADGSGLVPLANQVAGHRDGVQSLEGGRLVVKDCLAREVRFYEEVKEAASGSSNLSAQQVELLGRLLKAMPECFGSWEQYYERRSGSAPPPDKVGSTPRIVLENLTFAYDKPNVCDIKLGTQLWDEDASEEKRQRMEKVTASTTSGTHGIRLTGWQTYDNETKNYRSVPKTFGKAIKPEHLDLGLRMFLACPEEGDAEQARKLLAGAGLPSEAPTEHEANAVTAVGPYHVASLPSDLVERMLRSRILQDLEEIHDIFTRLEVRMRGASLLLVYEGEPNRLRQSLADTSAGVHGKAQVRLIDFGHATIVPGQGPDHGVLLGLRTVLALVHKQLQRLEAKRRSANR